MEKEIENCLIELEDINRGHNSFVLEKKFYNKYSMHPLISLYFNQVDITDFISVYTRRMYLYNMLCELKNY